MLGGTLFGIPLYNHWSFFLPLFHSLSPALSLFQFKFLVPKSINIWWFCSLWALMNTIHWTLPRKITKVLTVSSQVWNVSFREKYFGQTKTISFDVVAFIETISEVSLLMFWPIFQTIIEKNMFFTRFFHPSFLVVLQLQIFS